MKKRCISKDWKFKNVTLGSNYTDIDLPHDYQIKQKRDPSESAGIGFYPDTEGRYVKYIYFDKDHKNKHYILDIDGAYMCTHIEFNEHFVAMHPYGYTPFLADITDLIITNVTNKLVITTSPLPRSCRWYSGNGIYRDVFLWEGGSIRIEPRDMFISTLSASEEEASLSLRYTVSADEDADADVIFTVFDPENNAVKTENVSTRLKKGKNEYEHTLNIPHPKLWNIDTPNLCTLKTEIVKDGEITDISENTFGIRTVTADSENGLLINGRFVKLRGGCIHHDHGELGAAAFPAAEERKVRLLQEAGFNALRCAHNPPSLAFLECCDRLGMIVMDEAFDAWNKRKTPSDYHLFFSDWWARDISYMVKRDRNHPCVLSYSIGNEILEIDGTSDSAEWSRRLSDEIRKYDDTRLVTSGIQKIFVKKKSLESTDPDDYKEYIENTFKKLDRTQINSVTLPYEKNLDIVGVNYYFENYSFECEQYPDRVLWGSETQAIHFYRSWSLAEKNNCILGDFTWTAYDNMGEVGAGRGVWERDGGYKGGLTLGKYPWRNCYQGDLDLCGYRRPQSYYREALWIGNKEPRIFTTHPEHFGENYSGTNWHWYDVHESWTYDDKYIGRPIKAETYTDADKIVWFVNGKIVGESVPVDGIATVSTIYEKGYIRAVSYKNGKEHSEYTLETTGSACAISLSPEKEELCADGRDLCYVRISLRDKNGRPVVGDDKEIECYVNNGELLAFFSGDPKTEDDASSNRCHTFNGCALAIIRTKSAGNISVTVCGKELAGETKTVVAKDLNISFIYDCRCDG
ncbi:MAG: DUF4982 domain-containing protein [Clostridia bacterium]|nr:DUF4982 domain-containing protein [Clostridia bacterium]